MTLIEEGDRGGLRVDGEWEREPFPGWELATSPHARTAVSYRRRVDGAVVLQTQDEDGDVSLVYGFHPSSDLQTFFELGEAFARMPLVSSDVVVEQVLEDLRVVRRVAFDLLEQKPWVRHSLTWHVGEALPDDQRGRVTFGQLGQMLDVLVPPPVTEDAVGRVLEALGRNPELKAGVRKALLGEVSR